MNWSHPLCCTVFLRVQYSAQFSSSYTWLLSLISLNILSCIIWLPMTPCCTIHLLADSLFCNMQNCISDMNKWTFHNKLQLNKDETEALLFTVFNQPYSCNIPDVPKIGQSPLLPIAQVSCLTMCSPWSNRLTEFARLHALQSGGSDQFCSFSPLGPQKLFVTSLELSWLVYCDSLLAGIPQKLMNKIQRVINC